jgi:hypothetical protein
MSTLLRIKGAAALLLVASIALPQSTCSGYRGPDGKFVAELPRDSTRAAFQPAVERDYVLDDVHLGDPGSWLKLAIYLWPLAAVAVLARARSRRLRLFISIVEPILAVCSAYVIWLVATFFAEPAAGAYVAIGALAIYFAVCVVDVWRAVRNRRSPGADTAAPVGSAS